MKPHIGSEDLAPNVWLPMSGFIAQLVEQRIDNAEVMGSNPVETLIFFRLLLSNCSNWKIYCDDHSSLSFIVLLQNKHTTLVAENGENLISAQPRISVHLE